MVVVKLQSERHSLNLKVRHSAAAGVQVAHVLPLYTALSNLRHDDLRLSKAVLFGTKDHVTVSCRCTVGGCRLADAEGYCGRQRNARGGGGSCI